VSRPEPGLMTFVDGHPVELLHLVSREERGETWMVKPLFVAPAPVRQQFIRKGEALRPLHTKQA
jgi:hypothetical protein